ncbi:MAG: antibiotic biosynthesis monooxygenase family protein [Bacteroidota bacterium]|nr:antibiotic biosynthesis monooxygenase family protein [Bacteroidota bacterium]
MINRIVRMSFEPDKVADFLQVFEQAKEKIAAFEGCEGLTLLRDAHQAHVMFTYSYWRDQDCLNKYRFSDLFKDTWAKTKIHFNDKPLAWSLEVLQLVK